MERVWEAEKKPITLLTPGEEIQKVTSAEALFLSTHPGLHWPHEHCGVG